MACYQFAFGPNRSYFCNVDSGFAFENLLPESLERVLTEFMEDNPRGLEIPYDVAFPMEEGLYIMSCTADGGWYEDVNLGPNYAKLDAFIKRVAAAGDHTVRTVFGPGYSYFSTSPAGYSWQNLPPALEDEIQNGLRKRQPTNIALGVQGTYVVLYDDASVTSDLHGHYPLVEALLLNKDEIYRRQGIMYLALNPFVAGEYYAVYGDNSTTWNLPTAWNEDVTGVSQIFGSEAAEPEQTTAGGTEPAQTIPAESASERSDAVSTYTPEYVPQASAAPPPPPKPRVPHPKVNWKEGIELGLKVAEGITKIIEAVHDGDGDKC